MQNGATLGVKGKGIVESGIARRTRVGGGIMLGFAKDVLPLAASDREIIFGLTMERFSIKTKFDGKDMMYRGKLAV